MKKNLGQLLVEKGLIGEKTLAEALQRQVIFGGRLGTNLLEMGAVKEEELMKLLAFQYHVPYANPDHFRDIPPQVLESVPRELLAKHGIIPISVDAKRITLAMRDPQLLDVIDEVSFQTGKTIQPVIASELRIVQALEHFSEITREARYIAATREVFAEMSGAGSGEITAEESEIIELTEDDLEPAELLDTSQVNEAFFNVRNRDEVAQTVIRAGLVLLDDVFMFMVKGDEALGWMSGGSAKPIVDFGCLSLPITRGNAMDRARRSLTLERFHGVDMFESNPWLKELSLKVPKEVIICPLMLKKHMVSALVGFSFQKPISDEEAEFLVRIMRKASVVFEILIMKSRIIML